MADEIVIGRLVLDASDVESTLASQKSEILSLEASQKQLKKSTDNLTTANEDEVKSFVSNELALKKLKSEYAANQKSVLDLTKAQLGLDNALKASVKTEQDAIDNTKELKNARKSLDESTSEGAAAIAQINAKIDENDKLINRNSSSLEKQKQNVGNYPEIMGKVGAAFGGTTQQIIGFVQSGKDVISSVSELAGAVANSTQNILGFETSAVKAAKASAALQSGQDGAASSAVTMGKGTEVASGGMKALTTSSLAFIATPVGLVLLAIALALGILIAVFKNFQPLVDKIEQGMAALAAVFNVVKNTILAVVTGTKSLSEAFDGLGKGMSDAAREAAALTKAQQDLEDAQKSQEVITARNRAEINKLNVALKNRTLTEKERLKIADEIEAREQQDYKQRKALVDQEVKNARAAIAIKAQFTEEEKRQLKEVGDATKELAESRGGNYDEEYEALNKARLKAIALEDESTTNLEKIYNKRDKLQDDARAKQEAADAKAKASRDKALQDELKNMQNRIDIMRLEAAASNLSTQQQIDNAEKLFEKQNELARKGLSGTDLDKKLRENAQELSTSLLSIADAQIAKEAENQKRRFNLIKATTAEIYDDQMESAELLAKGQIQLLNKSALSEKAYADEVIKINNIKVEALALIQANFDEAEKVRIETQIANEKAINEVRFQLKLQGILDQDIAEQEIKQQLRDAEYAKELEDLTTALENQQVTYELFEAKKLLAEKKYIAESKKNDKVLTEQKKAQALDVLNSGLNALGQLFEGSKAIAVAQALVNTYQGITAGVALGYPMAIPAVAFAALAGFAAVRNILKTNKTSTSIDSSTGGAGGDSAPRTAGAGSFVNTAQTETVAQVSDKPVEQNTLVSPPILIVEQLNEVQDNLAVKITSG